MDFEVVGLEGLVGSDNTGFASLANSDHETKQEWYGSGFLKQERANTTTTSTTEDVWRSSKLLKTESLLLPQRNTLLKSNNVNLFTDNDQQHQQMLSFSCPKSESLSSKDERSSQTATLPGFHITSSGYNRSSTGYNYGNVHGFFTDARGPFTPSQWMELEHQALIYKYITANVPIPSNLLIPVRKALDSIGFSSFSGGLLRPNTLPWGAFHLGFSSNTDPEPGRCRRTDGKKWRCSRDAVSDQKYCERHMNRGRHRSRKHVEGQSGHSAAAATTTTDAKPMPVASSSSVSASVVGPHSSGASNNLTIAQNQQQLRNLQPDSLSNLSSATPLNRMFLQKENLGERLQDSASLSMLASKIEVKSKQNPFFISKLQNPYQESSQIEFGLVNSDSLLNPSQNSSSLINCRNFTSSQDITDQETVSQHSIRQFMDGWPKNQSDQSAVSWSQLDVQSDRTLLSISIPIAPTDFRSSTSSPNDERSTVSPLRLSREMDSKQMGMGVGIFFNEHKQRQANWIPVSWETTMGGPLGEVLHNGNNSASECMNSSLLAERWDSGPQLGSSPTGILQKTTTLGSVSNSSAGSSPRTENNRTNEGASLCSDLLGSSLMHSSSLRAL